MRVRAAGEPRAAAPARSVAAAGQAAGSLAEGAREAARGSRGRLLRARPHGHRARGAQRSRQARSRGCANLQSVRARLRDARRERQGGAELPARARDGAAGLRHPSQLGVVPVQQRASARIDPRIRQSARQPAVQDTRDRAYQRGPLQHRDR